MVTYQWIKFKDDAAFQSEDFKPDVWYLVEIDDEWPDGGVSLFGVEYNMRQSEISEFGPVVPAHN